MANKVVSQHSTTHAKALQRAHALTQTLTLTLTLTLTITLRYYVTLLNSKALSAITLTLIITPNPNTS